MGRIERSGAASLEVSDDTTITLLGFSPDGRTLTAVGRGGGNSVLVWDAADGKKRGRLFPCREAFGSAFALSPDAALAAAMGGPDEDEFAVFDVLKGEIRSRRQDESGRSASVGAFLDGKTLAVFRRPDGRSTRYGSLLLWDAVAGAGDALALKSEVGSVFCATASPDGKLLAAAGSSGSCGCATPPPARW